MAAKKKKKAAAPAAPRGLDAWRLAGARCANASDRAPRPEMIVRRQPGNGSRSYSMNGTLIEVDGRHDVVRYDERNKIIEISVDGVIVRVKPR